MHRPSNENGEKQPLVEMKIQKKNEIFRIEIYKI